MVKGILTLLCIILFLFLYVIFKMLCLYYSVLLRIVNKTIFFLFFISIIAFIKVLIVIRVRDIRFCIVVFNSFFVCFYLIRGPPLISKLKKFIDWRILKWEITQKEENIGIIHIS